MKRRKPKSKDLLTLFQSTCGWCGKQIPPDTPVFGGHGKARSGLDLTGIAGRVIRLRLIVAGKTTLVGVAALDSEAKRDGYDFAYLTCNAKCGERLKEAFQADIDLGNPSGLA